MVLVLCASVSIFTTIAIIVILASETYLFFNFETPILAGVEGAGGSEVPLRMQFAREGEVAIATPIAELAEALDFDRTSIRAGDMLRLVDEAGTAVETLTIAEVGPSRLVLESLPAGLAGTTAIAQVWRDEATVREFLTGSQWSPLLGAEKHFGIWPLVTGTLMVTLIAMLVAIPLGLMTAVYLSEYARHGIRAFLKPVLEILAGVPTVVYGFFALTVITPFLQTLNDGVDIYNVLSAGIAVGIMCLPIVCSISEDSLQAVPRSLREGAYATGATKFDVSLKVVIPAALSGIVASALLAIARAVGETMIVTLAAGNLARLVFDPREQGQTMTAYMVQIFLGDTSNFGIEYYSSYAVAASLFVLTFVVTVIGHIIRVKFREEYA
jgi:phosphate transport system permease protein